MAFFSKARGALKQAVNMNFNLETSMSNPSLLQKIRFMSSSKLFVGGISYGTDDTSLGEAFSKYGEVVEARVIVDRETGRSRGFGFVTYTSSEEASSAIQALDGQDLHGRRIRVNYANDRARGPPGYGGGGGYGNYGGGFGGGYNDGNYAGGGGSNPYGGVGGNYGGNYGGNTYGSAESGGSYGAGGGGNQSFDLSGRDSGSDGFVPGSGNTHTGFTSSGFDGSPGMGYGSGNQSGSNEGSSGGAEEGYGQADQLEGNFRDDVDEPDDYANRRA